MPEVGRFLNVESVNCDSSGSDLLSDSSLLVESKFQMEKGIPFTGGVGVAPAYIGSDSNFTTFCFLEGDSD